jgi:membrane associated rhomboid family serine protease/Zn-finger nucleic acid-binding protein
LAEFPKNLFPNLAAIRATSSIQCPDCAVRMRLFSCAGVVLDKCDQCQGIWFDAHELGVFRNTLQAQDLQPLTVLGAESDPKLTIRTCPRDGNVLTEFAYSNNRKVRLNRCDRCNGIWSPFAEIVHLVNYVKTSQAIEPDVRALGHELLEHQALIERWRSVEEFGSVMNQRVYPWWFAYGNPLLRPIGIILPLGTSTSAGYETYATFGIVVLNILVFAIYRGDSVSLAMVPKEVWSGARPFSVLTSFFAHAGVLHLVGNLFYFWIFGAAVEARLGLRRFLTLYFSAGFVANGIMLVMHSASMIPSLGASGAISAVLGAYLFLFPSASVRTYVIYAIVDVPAWIYLGGWFSMQIFSAWVSAAGDLPGIAWSAHISGFLFGVFLMLAFKIRESE